MLDTPATTAIRVAVATTDGAATVVDHDYEATRQTVTFAPGQTVRTVTVLVDGDTQPEDYEAFTVGLHDPVGAGSAAPPRRCGSSTTSGRVPSPTTCASVKVAWLRSGRGSRVATTDPSPPR